MQIVIDIDENVFTRLFDNGIEDYAIVNDDLFKIAKSIRTGIPFDKIRAEILKLDDVEYDFDGYYKAVTDALQIIDKYKAESEEV